MLSLNTKLFYIHEPFNKSKKTGEVRLEIPYWFYYFTNNDNYLKRYDDIVNFKYTFKQYQGTNLKTYANFIRNTLKYKFASIRKKRILIKDPIAIMSIDKIYQKYNNKIIIIIRHPTSIISSYKIKKYDHPFSDFLNQSQLMKDKIADYEDEIEQAAKKKLSYVEQGILLYNIIYSVIAKYYERYKNKWYFCRYEDIIRSPKKEFQKLFNFLDLEYNEKLITKIKRNTNSTIYPYKKRLNTQEIKKIKYQTKQVSKNFYNQNEWL